MNTLKIKIKLFEKVEMTHNCYDVCKKTIYHKYNLDKIKKSTIEKILKQQNSYSCDDSYVTKYEYTYYINDRMISKDRLDSLLKDFLVN